MTNTNDPNDAVPPLAPPLTMPPTGTPVGPPVSGAAAPTGYPPAAPTGYPPAAPTGYPTEAATGYPAGAMPLPPRAPSHDRTMRFAWIGGGAAVAVIVALFAIGALTQQAPDADTPPVALPSATAAPTPEATVPQAPPAPPAPAPSPTEEEDLGTLPLTPGEYFPDPNAETIQTQLTTMLDSYRLASRQGDLWKMVPDTDFNRTGFQAFLYFVTDLKVATIWAVDDATAKEWAAEATAYEQLFLDGKPLGGDVNIDTGERIFTYDGDTGEGGWTDK